MRILLANYILGGQTGSETWVASLKEQLETKGHQVYTRTPQQNIDFTPDLAIINHNTCLHAFRHLQCKKIFTSHGVIPDLEQPVEGADVYVSVSEEVQANLKDKGFESVIIRNGIDCQYFKSTEPVNQELKRVLFSSNYGGTARLKVKLACEELGIQFETIGGIHKTKNVLEAINRADLVVGLGRTAYEAMACERNVLVYDYNGGDGVATLDTLPQYRQNNCSGRYNRHDYSVEDIKNLLKQYNPKLGKHLRGYIIENNNMEKVADEYLEL